MAKNKKISSTFMRTLIGDENEAKIGNYKESTGGGTPLEKGEKLKDHPEAKRVQQPRDEEGRFTYNSVNKKPLKYGPSRGTTVVPFLRGVKLKCAVEKNDKINYNGMIYLAGMDITAEEILTCFQEWTTQQGFGKMETGVSKKVGRRSNIEKEAIAKNEKGLIGEHLTRLDHQTIESAVYSIYSNSQKEGKNMKVNKNHIKKKENQNDNQNSFKENINNDLNKQQEKSISKVSDDIKNNPKDFVQKNYAKIKEVMNEVEGMKASDVVKFMMSGKFNSLDELKDFVSKNK